MNAVQSPKDPGAAALRSSGATAEAQFAGTPVVAALDRSPAIRLLLVVTRMDVGGVPSHVLTVLDGLCRRGYLLTLACADCTAEHRSSLDRMGVDLVQLPFKRLLSPLSDLKALFALVQLIRRRRFHVVHTHMSKGALLGGIAGRLAGTPVIVNTAHNLGAVAMPRAWLRALFCVYDRWLLGSTADAVITVTTRVREAVVAQRIVPAQRVHAIANGISPTPLPEPAERNAARRALRLELASSADTPVIGCVARLVWFKGLDTLIEALPAIAFACPAVQVVIVGDGPLRAALAGQAAALGVAERLHFFGERQDVARLLLGMDLFVLPSVSEGMPLTILEAMNAGLPVVATAVGGVPELVIPGETGLLVPPRAPAALAAALQRLLLDPPLRHHLGERGRQRLLAEFSAAAMVNATDLLLRRLLLAQTGLTTVGPRSGDEDL